MAFTKGIRTMADQVRRRGMLLGSAASMAAAAAPAQLAQAQPGQPQPAPAAPAGAAQRLPNILVIFGDDIGLWNISHNNRGAMGYRTPNIDRIHAEGATFTDYYGEQSCTAGRAAFITGQSPVRTGLTKVGIPGADVGLQKE